MIVKCLLDASPCVVDAVHCKGDQLEMTYVEECTMNGFVKKCE